MAKLDSISYNGTKYELAPEIAPLFSASTAYNKGDCVIYNAVLYKFTANHSAGAWTGNDVEAFEVGNKINKISDSVAPEFNASTPYTAGSYVYENGVLYRFTQSHSGAWTGSDAEVVTVGGEITDLKADLKNAIDASQSLILRETTLDYAIGTIALTGGVNVSSNTKCRTNHFCINKNLVVANLPADVKVSLRFYHYEFDSNRYLYDGGTDWLNTKTDINNALSLTNSGILRVVFGYIDDRDMTGTTDFSHFTNIFMYQFSQYETPTIPFFMKGTITNSSSASYCQNLKYVLRKGDTIHYSVWMRGEYVCMAAYDVNETEIYRKTGKNSTTLNLKGTYTATQEFEYVRLCTMLPANPYYVSDGYAFIETLLNKTISNAIKDVSGESILVGAKPLAILCAKEVRYNDGTHPSVEYYILADGNDVYISRDLVEKHKIFTFDGTIYRYKFGVRKNDDIIAVYRNEFATVTAEYGPELDNIRRNPYVFIANENYANQHEVDFGTFDPSTKAGLKPTAWLENVGFCSLPNGDIIFVEYTREGVVYTANCWKISANSDIKDSSNWIIKKQFLVAQNDSLSLDETYIEHWHAAQHDPYTGTLYVSTGDLDRKSQIFYSTDNGETFVQQSFVDPATGSTVTYGQKLFRLLNINFTENDVYWSSDSSSEHVVIHCKRSETGGLQPDSISVLATLPNLSGTPATYGTVYFEEFDALVMMESCDTNYTEMTFRVFDLTDNTVKPMCVIKSATGQNAKIGFRTEYTEFEPIDGVIKLGYGYNDRYANRNALCGNAGGSIYINNVNNLNIRIFRKANGTFIAKFGCYYL